MDSTEIRIQGLEFELYIENEAITAAIDEIADQLNHHYGDHSVNILVVLQGAETFSNYLLPLLKFPYKTHHTSIKTYHGLASGLEMKMDPPHLHISTDKPLLILEDIVDTGFTLNYLFDLLKEHGIEHIQLATLLFKPDSLRYPVQPSYIGFHIGPEFVVGFGMDYQEEGRQYEDIYKLKPAAE